MKRYLPIVAAIVCISCAFVWQTASKSQQRPATKSMLAKSKLPFLEIDTEQQQKDIDTLLTTALASLPYRLGLADMSTPLHTTRTPLDWAVTNLVNEERGYFSRAPMPRYEYVAHVRTTGSDLIVYRSAVRYSDDVYPVSYGIAIIPMGKTDVQKKIIAGISSLQAYTTSEISADGQVTSTHYKQKWQYDPRKAGYKNNKVIATTVDSVTSIRFASEAEAYHTGK